MRQGGGKLRINNYELEIKKLSLVFHPFQSSLLGAGQRLKRGEFFKRYETKISQPSKYSA